MIAGHEEARLIYLGVAHELTRSAEPRLVIDIGGGSTEFIIGRGLEPERLESLKIGCVGMTERFFADGRLTAEAFAAAETVALAEIEAIAREFGPRHWHDAYASSGTAAALAEILEQNGFSGGGITPVGLARLKQRMLTARHIRRLSLHALKPERAPVLAAGLAIMAAAVDELKVQRIDPVGGALRLGVLYDLLGRTIDEDVRGVTVERFVKRYTIDREHAARVAALATGLYRRALGRPGAGNLQLLGWAAGEQGRLALLVFGCRGGLAKVGPALADDDARVQLLALRLAVLFHHARAALALPRIRLEVGRRIALDVSARWLAAHPLTAHLLAKERSQWDALRYPWKAARD